MTVSDDESMQYDVGHSNALKPSTSQRGGLGEEVANRVLEMKVLFYSRATKKLKLWCQTVELF
jgi:hypothetical protein